MYLKLGDRYGTTGEGGFEEYDGGWNATAGRASTLPITTNGASRRWLDLRIIDH